MTNPVQELLEKHSVRYTHSGRDFVTTCFNPEHKDTNPSFRVDKTSGIGHCFACGFKFNIFKYYGVLTNNVSIKIAKLKDKLREIMENMNGLEFPEGHTPITAPFRGCSVQTLREFGAFYTDRVEELTDRVCFPVYDITGKIAVFVARHSLSQGNPRYVNYPAGVTLPLYPAKLPNNDFTSIVLVEGIFDMLNLYDKGIRNAICCFGTNTLQADTRTKLLAFKAQGITRVYILFDGDTAGREAAKKLTPLIEDEGFVVETIHMADDTDPGVLSQEEVTQIKEYIK